MINHFFVPIAILKHNKVTLTCLFPFPLLLQERGELRIAKKKGRREATTDAWNVLAMLLLPHTSTVQYIRVQSEVDEINPELGKWKGKVDFW